MAKFAFAKDTKVFSAAVEQIRRKRGEMTEENIKKHYDRIKKGVSDEEVDEEEVVNATDAAIKLAEEYGIDISEVEGSGSDGRVTVGDVKAVIPEEALEGDEEDEEEE